VELKQSPYRKANVSDTANCSLGADSHPFSPYSTTNSLTHIDWLPTLKERFYKNQFDPNLKSSPPESGFVRNAVVYVPYDREIDEKGYQFTKDMYLTSNQLFFNPKQSKSAAQHTSADIELSGFSRAKGLDTILPSVEDKRTESQTSCVGYKYKLPKFTKSTIVASKSAYANDVDHLGLIGSPNDDYRFQVKKPVKSPAENFRWPTNLKDDGFTRSNSKMAKYLGTFKNQSLPLIQSNQARILENQKHQLPKEETIVGPKQTTGSITNNKPFFESAYENPGGHFKSETSERYTTVPVMANIKCSKITPSGFSLCNKSEGSIRNSEDQVFQANCRNYCILP
jgi:hypothetical protein